MLVKDLKNTIEFLGADDEFSFTYKNKPYTFRCYDVSERFGNSYSVRDGINSMNVDKISNSYISLYTFDMMGNRTIYKMAIDEIVFGEMSIYNSQSHDMKFEVVD